jgi:hypothetical protein
LFLLLSKEIEIKLGADRDPHRGCSVCTVRVTVFQLAGLFALDAFAAGWSFKACWLTGFTLSMASPPARLDLLRREYSGGLICLLAVSCPRIGLIRTMVFTHIPSNILLMLVPLMPGLSLAILVLLLRYSISQMDVPTRQSYTMAVVAPDERSAASGVTTIARSVGAVFSPALSGLFLASALLFNLPFFLAVENCL